MKVLFLSHSASGGPYTVGSHQLSRQLVAQGHRVLHMSPPVTPAHLLKLKDPFERARLRRWVSGGQAVFGVMDAIPGSMWPWDMAKRQSQPGRSFARGFGPSVRSLLRRHSFETVDVVLIDEPRLLGALDDVYAGAVVYRPTDLYAQLRGDAAILDLEKELIARADALVATSEPVAGHLRSLGATHVTVLENGVDLAHFVSPAAVDTSSLQLPPAPRAIYVGAFDDRFGIEWLQVAVTENPGVSFLLGGPAHGSLRRQLVGSNVHWLGALDYKDVPLYFAASQLGLLPLSNSPSNLGRSPMKIYEYGASGLPVVATATPELRRRALSFVKLADSPSDFAAAIPSALRGEAARVPFEEALAHGWEAKARQLLTLAISARHSRAPLASEVSRSLDAPIRPV